eukprot:3697692-Amphidinium_carterae.1
MAEILRGSEAVLPRVQERTSKTEPPPEPPQRVGTKEGKWVLCFCERVTQTDTQTHRQHAEQSDMKNEVTPKEKKKGSDSKSEQTLRGLTKNDVERYPTNVGQGYRSDCFDKYTPATFKFQSSSI